MKDYIDEILIIIIVAIFVFLRHKFLYQGMDEGKEKNRLSSVPYTGFKISPVKSAIIIPRLNEVIRIFDFKIFNSIQLIRSNT